MPSTQRAGSLSRLAPPRARRSPLVCAAVQLLACIAMYSAVCSPVKADQPRQVPGTSVSLVVSDRFVEVDGVAGLKDLDTGASIVVTELPQEGFAGLAAIFSTVDAMNGRLQGDGITVNESEDLLTPGGNAIRLAHGVQVAASGRVDKWLALVGGAKTALITMQVREELAFNSAIVRAVVTSVTFGAPPSSDQLIARLPFVVDIATPFRFIGAPAGSALFLTIGPDDLNTDARQPMVMIVRQVSSVKSQPLEQMAEIQLRSTSSFVAAEISSRYRMTFAEAPGIFLGGKSRNGGRALEFRQYFAIADDGKFIRLVASAPEGQLKSLVRTIQQMAQSVRVK